MTRLFFLYHRLLTRFRCVTGSHHVIRDKFVVVQSRDQLSDQIVTSAIQPCVLTNNSNSSDLGLISHLNEAGRLYIPETHGGNCQKIKRRGMDVVVKKRLR